MKRSPLTLVVLAFVVALMLYVGYHRARRSGPAFAPHLTQSSLAPDFSLESLDGKTMRLSDYRGKAVLLNFWATWCHGCQTEIPWFIDFQNQFKREGLAVVGASMDDDGWKSVTPFVAERKVNYAIIIGDEALGKLYDLGNMPRTVLIDREGRIAATYDGVVDRAKCEADIRALLREKP